MTAPIDVQLASLVADSTSRVLGARGLEFLTTLQAREAELTARWSECVELLEAYATLAEATGDVGVAAAKIEEELLALDPEMLPAARATAGHLLALGASRQRASAVLAAAEVDGATPRLRAQIARDRGLIAASERLWATAECELRAAVEMFRSCGSPLHAADATVYLAHAVGAQGKNGESIDLLLQQLDATPEGGLLELRTLLLLARLYLDRLDTDRAEELLQRAKAILPHDRLDASIRLATYEAEVAWWREDWDRARGHMGVARASSVRLGRPLFSVYAEYTLALIEFDAGELERALRGARTAYERGDELELPAIMLGARLLEVCALAALGRRQDALVVYRSLRPPNTQGVEARYSQGMSAVAELLLRRVATSDADAAAYAAYAEANIDALVARNDLGVRWMDSTMAMQILARRVRAYAAPAQLAKLLRRPRAVAVDPEGAFIDLDNAERVSIAHRPVLQRLLVRLRRAAEAHPGELVTFSELVGAAWPGDRATESSLRARLRVAVSTLRQLALDDALKTHDRGYSLQLPDPRPTP